MEKDDRKWEIIESEYLIRRPWLTARRDRVKLPPAPQIRLIIRLLQDLHPEIHPKIKSDSLIIILYIKHYLQVLNNLTIMMPCGILLYFLLFCLFLSNKYVTLKYHFGLDWN